MLERKIDLGSDDGLIEPAVAFDIAWDLFLVLLIVFGVTKDFVA